MIEQRSPEWYRQRAGKLTASAFSDLMALTRNGPSTSRANLIVRLACERITGICDEGYTNAAMQRGIDLEAEACDAYAFELGVSVEFAEFTLHPELPFVGCSPDRLVGDHGLLEVKCPSAEAKHLAAIRANEHAQEYRWQLQGQLFVTGRDWVDVASYDPRFPTRWQLAIARIQRDEKAIAELRDHCIKANAEIVAIVDEFNKGIA